MDTEKSPIHSMNVNVGTFNSASSASSVNTNHPWIVLVCADLGFTSHKPERISSATINELLSTTEIVITGTVDKDLPDGIAPFHIEYPLTDLKDLSPSSVTKRLSYLKHFRRAYEVLEDISEKKVPVGNALQDLSAMPLPSSIIGKLGLIGTVPPASTASPKAIDSILSMVDIGDDSGRDIPPATSPDFVAALADGAAEREGVSMAAVHDCMRSIETLIGTLGKTVFNQPFFKTAVSSWNALKTVLKLAGRNNDILFFLYSAPCDAAERHFGDVLNSCATGNDIPDLVLWDYPVSTDTATMEQYSSIGELADRFKTMVTASLDYHDDLYRRIINGEPLKRVIEQPSFIPLRRLQKAASSRCLTLCVPDVVLPRGKAGDEITIPGAWLLALQWTASVIENSAPFHLQNNSISQLNSFEFPKSGGMAPDAYQAGITLLRPNSITTPRVLLEDSESPYGSLLFNMLVNRTARLAAQWVDGQNASVAVDDAASLLERFLRTELAPYHILSSDEAVSVNVSSEQSLVVTVDSTVTVAGFPVRFQFSLTSPD